MDKTKTQLIDFTPVTGSCRCCGGNKYHFDEKEQTFVCEFCGAEVYLGRKETEEHKANKQNVVTGGIRDIYGNIEKVTINNNYYNSEPSKKEEKIHSETTIKISADTSSAETEDDEDDEEEGYSYSGGGCYGPEDKAKGAMLCFSGGAMAIVPTFLTGLMTTSASSAAEAVSSTTEIMSNLISTIGVISRFAGIAIMILGLWQFIHAIINGY